MMGFRQYEIFKSDNIDTDTCPVFVETYRLVSLLSKHGIDNGIGEDVLIAQTLNKNRRGLIYESERHPMTTSLTILLKFKMVYETRVIETDRDAQLLMLYAAAADNTEYTPPMTNGYYMTLQGMMMFQSYFKNATKITDPIQFTESIYSLCRE